MRISTLALVTAVLASTAHAEPFVDPRSDGAAFHVGKGFAAATRDPACHAAKLVSTGGGAPRAWPASGW